MKTKSQKLARLIERKNSAWDAAKASPPINRSNPHYRKWSSLLRQISRLEASFVVYQGRELEAETVASQSGDISTNHRLYFSGEERLHRTPDGTFYLYRENKRVHVHRLSLTAAILWSITKANPTEPELRRDALALIGSSAVRGVSLRVLPAVAA